jgi:hypothetical protein
MIEAELEATTLLPVNPQTPLLISADVKKTFIPLGQLQQVSVTSSNSQPG